MGPDPAVAAVRSAVRSALGDLDAGRGLVVACSGGADSLALAAAVAFEAPRVGFVVGAAVVDHGLQEDSAEVADRTQAVLVGLGLSSHVERVVVRAAGGPEAAARTARYAALERAAAPDAYVLLGHTRDDQAETVLLGLGRGSGPRSIAGMQRVAGRWVRPLLGIARTTTRAACVAQDLPVWDDPHNVDPRFRRVRLRTQVLPLLEDVLAGGVAAALARTAEQLRQDVDALDELAAAHLTRLDPAAKDLSVDGLLALPRALRTRVLRLWARRAGVGPLSAVHIDGLDRLCTQWRGQGPIDVPGGVTVTRRSGRLHLYASPSGTNRASIGSHSRSGPLPDAIDN